MESCYPCARGGTTLDDGGLTLRFLGDIEVCRGGERLELPPSKKTRALLAYLAVTGRAQRRAHLCGLLWDVADDPRGALRWSLSRLRPVVDDAGRRRLVAEGETVRLDGADVDIDVVAVRQALAGGAAGCATEALLQVAAAFRGEFLEGLELADFDGFQAWCVAEREQLRTLRAAALGALVERLGHDPEAALPHARALVQCSPLDEAARGRLVRMLGATRRQEEAEQQYRAGKRLLEEFGAPLSGELVRAWKSCTSRAQAPQNAATPAVPTPTPPARVSSGALVGRRAERDALLAVLADVAAQRRAHVVLLTGEPGIGKTRLLAELTAAVRAAGGAALTGCSHEVESGRPYAPWIEALGQLPEIGAELREGLAPLRGELPADVPAERVRDRLFSAVAAAIAALARARAPVVVVLDDLQWCDEASAQLLHHVARTGRDEPLLVALAARAGELPDNGAALRVLRGLRRDATVQEIHLGPLDRDDTRALVAAIDPALDGDRVHLESGGNPLFSLEVARAAPHRRADVPPTLSRLVRDRLDRLPPEAMEVLRWGAVLGPTFGARRLELLLRVDFEELTAALELLERHDLLRVGGDGEGTYAFAHDVVRRAVHAGLSEPRRRLMHGRIARTLAGQDGAGDALAADIAHHAGLAGESGLAAQACVAAGRRCLRLFALADADALARRGLRHADALAEPTGVTVQLELYEVGLAARRPEAPEQVAEVLEGLAERALTLGCRAHARLGFHLLAYLGWERNDGADARRYMLRAEEVSRATDERERALALAETARCLALLERDLPHAEALALEARAVARQHGLNPYAVSDALGLLRAHAGRDDEAAELFVRARAIARGESDRLREFEALEHLVMLAQQRGDFGGALAHAPALRELAGKLREGSEAPVAEALAAVSVYALAQPEAGPRLEAALEQLRQADAKRRLAHVLLTAAEVDRGRGEAALACARASEALGCAELLERPSETAWARALLAVAGCEEVAAEQRARLGQDLAREVAAHVRRLAEPALASASTSSGGAS